MDFHEQYHSMNERIAPDDALVADTLARMKDAPRPRRARRTARIVIAVAAALACVTTALAANQEAVLRVLYQLAPGVAAYMQPVNLVSEEQGIRMEVVSADVDGSEAGVYLTLTDLEGGRFGDTAPDLFDSWSLEYPHLSVRAARARLLGAGLRRSDPHRNLLPQDHRPRRRHPVRRVPLFVPQAARRQGGADGRTGHSRSLRRAAGRRDRAA